MTARVLRRDSPRDLQRLERVVRQARPQLRATEFDVEPGTPLGWQIRRRLPLTGHVECAANVLVAEADGHGHLVNADAVGAERGAQVDSLGYLVAEAAGLAEVGIGGVRVAGATGDDGGPHV